jgi:hypothetical protein
MLRNHGTDGRGQSSPSLRERFADRVEEAKQEANAGAGQSKAQGMQKGLLRPDLRIVSVWRSRGRLMVRVQNRGPGRVPLAARLGPSGLSVWVDGKLKHACRLKTLDPANTLWRAGGTITYNTGVTLGPPPRNVRVKVDNLGHIDEWNELNNVSYKKL